ncbi:BamA/TamA family outer membrane protein [Kiritimatiellota bacterium B12222]|nr:BamA/TamA family outer membrane protein [Kiritimatiellota bacterium B12222]
MTTSPHNATWNQLTLPVSTAPPMKSIPYLLSLITLLWMSIIPLNAQSIILLPEDVGGELKAEYNWLPYAFFSDSFGLGLGAGVAYSRWPAPETSVLGAVTVGTKGSYNFAGGFSQLRIPGTKRWYVSPYFIGGYYVDQFIYIGHDNPGFEGQRAGANDSSPDNYASADQWDNQVQLQFTYLLPIGNGAGQNIVNVYKVKYGMLIDGATGASAFNPFKSGRTSFLFTPQWRDQTLQQENIQTPLETWNITVGMEWDNRDFPANPARGTYFKASYQKDFGNQGGLSGWEAVEGEFEYIHNIGKNERAKQRLLVFDFSTNYVLNWENDAEGFPTHRPPQYEAATLGGLYRMRGFESNRFSDQAAVYYSMEYRVIPQWQPLLKAHWLNFAQIQYWQWALFAEAGRVSENYDSELFYEDLHYDGGVSLRGMLHQAVLRLDFAGSEEGMRVVAMYGQPF